MKGIREQTPVNMRDVTVLEEHVATFDVDTGILERFLGLQNKHRALPTPPTQLYLEFSRRVLFCAFFVVCVLLQSPLKWVLSGVVVVVLLGCLLTGAPQRGAAVVERVHAVARHASRAGIAEVCCCWQAKAAAAAAKGRGFIAAHRRARDNGWGAGARAVGAQK